MKTCSPAMVSMRPLSIKLKVKMRPSVLLTVLKFLFSRVRKYFWLREMVESWAESLRMDSSRTEVCSGDEPCLEGMMARAASFSTYKGHIRFVTLREQGACLASDKGTYSNLKVHHLLGERAHFIVEAEPVLSRIVRRKHEIALSLLCSIEYNLVRGSDHRVVHIERAAGLHLRRWLLAASTVQDVNHEFACDMGRQL
jgi:hypothetical protein